MSMCKIKNRVLFFYFLVVFSSLTIVNAAERFEVFGKIATFDLPKNWKAVTKEIGVPLKLLGPLHEGRRPVITFVPIDLKNEKILLKDASKAEEGYKVSRLTWLQKFNGTAIKFKPLKVYKQSNNEVHKFGYTYSFNNVNYSENSYYIYCNNNNYHLKSLVQLEHGKKWDRVVEQIINSFGCK